MKYSWKCSVCSYKVPLPSLLYLDRHFFPLVRSRFFFPFLDRENLIKILPLFAAQEINYTFWSLTFFPFFFHHLLLSFWRFLVILICNFNKTWHCRSSFLKAAVFNDTKMQISSRDCHMKPLTLLPCLFISTFSPTLFISRTVFESCFSPSLMICSTQRVRFFFKSIVLTFLTKISTANSIWGFRNVDKVLFIFFFSLPFFLYVLYSVFPL